MILYLISLLSRPNPRPNPDPNTISISCFEQVKPLYSVDQGRWAKETGLKYDLWTGWKKLKLTFVPSLAFDLSA